MSAPEDMEVQAGNRKMRNEALITRIEVDEVWEDFTKMNPQPESCEQLFNSCSGKEMK